MEVKEDRRQNTGNDDTERRGENLENVVCVLDHNSHDQSPDSLYRNDRPDDRRVTTQKPLLGYRRGVFRIDREKGNDD